LYAIHLISIEFQSIDNNLGTSPKTFSSFSIVVILQSVRSILKQLFSTNYWNSSEQDLTVESRNKTILFLSLSYMQISIYLRPNINQIIPEILGVKEGCE
jgi:hypothetical protein